MMKRIIVFLLIIVMCFSFFVACKDKEEDVSFDSGDTTESTSDNTSDTENVELEPVDTTKRVSFFAVGDNIIHECVYLDAMTVATSVGAPTQYYFENMYSEIKSDITSADIAFVNAEGPLNPEYRPSGYPSFNAPAEAGSALVNVGFDVINLANNHMLDFNKGHGLQGTIDYWKEKEVVTLGGHESCDDYNNIRIISKNGIDIAILSYTYGTNGIKLGSDTPDIYIPYINDSEIERQIGEAKGKADVVLVSMHWGDENSFEPNGEQKRLAKLIADCGADAIIGHHSHTIQPVEWLEGKNGNKTLVIYSLGNILHTQLKSYNLVGGAVAFDIVAEENEKPYIENVVFTPTVCHYTANTAVLDSLDYYKRENLKIYYLSDYTEGLAKNHGSQHWNKFDLSTLKGYVADTISEEFLPESYK